MSEENQELDRNFIQINDLGTNTKEETLLSSSKPCCRTQIADFVIQQMTTVDKLHHRRKSRLALIQDKIKQPNGSLPNMKLPAWKKLDLEDKIPAPRIPNHQAVFTRGEICQDLHQNTRSYSLDDRNRVLDNSYNALHDVNTQSYFQNPAVQKLLIKQGLITPQGEVVCSLVEFNKWRAYLKNTVYKDKIKEALKQLDLARKANQDQTKRIDNFGTHESILSRHFRQIQRCNKVRQLKRQRQKADSKKYNERERLKTERRNRCEMNNTRQNMEHILRRVQREEKHMRKLVQVHQTDILIRNRMIGHIKHKEQIATVRKEAQNRFQVALKEQKYMESLHTQYQYQEVENVREEIIENFLRKETRKAAAAWQRRIEKKRSKIPQICEKLLCYRDENLARKVFKKWSTFVTKRKLRRMSRLTVFHLPTSLEQTVKFLTQNIGTVRPRSSSAPPQMITTGNKLKEILKKMSTEQINIQGLPCPSSTDDIQDKTKTLDRIKKLGTTTFRKKIVPALCKTIQIQRTSSKNSSIPSVQLCINERERKAKLIVDNFVELILTEVHTICKSFFIQIKKPMRKPQVEVIPIKDDENQPMKFNNDICSDDVNTTLRHFVDESIRVKFSSLGSTASSQQEIDETDDETKPFTITTARSESSKTEHLCRGVRATRVAVETSPAISLDTSLPPADGSKTEITKFKSLQSEVQEDVIEKQSVLIASGSYTKFADQIYRDMTSYVSADEMEVSILIEKQISENNLHILKHDFFRKLFMLCVSEADVKLANKLSKLSDPKSEEAKFKNECRFKNPSATVTAIRPSHFYKGQPSLPRRSRRIVSARSIFPRFQKSTPTIGEAKQKQTTKKVERSASYEITSVKSSSGKQQKCHSTAKNAGSTNSPFTMSLEGTDAIHSQNMTTLTHDLKIYADAEPNIHKGKNPEICMGQVLEQVETKSTQRNHGSNLLKLFKTLDIRSSSDTNAQLQNLNFPISALNPSTSVPTTGSVNNKNGSRINILEPLKPTLDRLLPNYQVSEMSHLDPFNMALWTEENKSCHVSPRPVRFKLPFLTNTIGNVEKDQSSTSEKDGSTSHVHSHQIANPSHSERTNEEPSFSFGRILKLCKTVSDMKESRKVDNEATSPVPHVKNHEFEQTQEELETEPVIDNSISPTDSIKSTALNRTKESLLNEILEFIRIVIHHRVLQDVIMIAGSSRSESMKDNIVEELYKVVRSNIVRLALHFHLMETNTNYRSFPTTLEYYKKLFDRVIDSISTLIIARLDLA